MNDVATIGHNEPPVDVDPLNERLEDETAGLRKRADELIAGASHATVTDQKTAEKATVLIKMINECVKKLDGARKDEKEPYLRRSKQVDGFFKPVADALGQAKSRVNGMLTTWQREEAKKAAEERRKQEAEAERLRQEAAAKEAEASSVSDTIEADRLKAQADEAERQAQQQTATVRSPAGATASTRTVWKHEIEDLDKAVAHALIGHPQAVADAVDGIVSKSIRAGVREFPGVRIYDDIQTVVR